MSSRPWHFLLRLRLHGTRRKFAQYLTVYTELSLFLYENIFHLHETGYFEIVLRARGYVSVIYHLNMRRSFFFRVMVPKRKSAVDEENDSDDTEKYFAWTDEEESLVL